MSATLGKLFCYNTFNCFTPNESVKMGESTERAVTYRFAFQVVILNPQFCICVINSDSRNRYMFK